MANQLSLTIGVNTYTIPIKLDNAATRAVLTRFATQKGIDLVGRTEQQIAVDILRHLLRYVAETSRDKQRQTLEGALRASLESQLVAENDVVD
jgi:hypothetical protein